MNLTDEQKKAFNEAAHKLGYARYYFKQAWSTVAASADGGGTDEVDYRKIQSFAEHLQTVQNDMERVDKQLIAYLGDAYAPSMVYAMNKPSAT